MHATISEVCERLLRRMIGGTGLNRLEKQTAWYHHIRYEQVTHMRLVNADQFHARGVFTSINHLVLVVPSVDGLQYVANDIPVAPPSVLYRPKLYANLRSLTVMMHYVESFKFRIKYTENRCEAQSPLSLPHRKRHERTEREGCRAPPPPWSS